MIEIVSEAVQLRQKNVGPKTHGRAGYFELEWLNMPPDDKSSGQSVPVLNYFPDERPMKRRELFKKMITWLGEVSAIFAVVAVLLTIEMIFLLAVDWWTQRKLVAGDLAYLMICAASAAVLSSVAVYVAHKRKCD